MIRRGVSEKGLEQELVLIQYSLQQTGSSKSNDKIEDVSIYRRDESRCDQDHDAMGCIEVTKEGRSVDKDDTRNMRVTSLVSAGNPFAQQAQLGRRSITRLAEPCQ